MRKVGIAGGLLAASLTVAGCEVAPVSTGTPDIARPSGQTLQYMQPTDEQLVQRTFTETVNFWRTRGIGWIASTKLVMLNGSTVARCEDGPVAHSYDTQPSYCDATSTVAVPAGATNEARVDFGGLSEGAIILRVNQAVGLARQDGDHALRKEWQASDQAREHTQALARCYAGVSTEALHPNEEGTATWVLGTITPEVDVMTARTRADQYTAGVNSGQCA
jgi:hypothetical protein